MIDDRTREFCELVDCDPSKVRDIPADPLGIDYRAEAAQYENRVVGTFVMPFGKHRDKTLDEIPRDYLEWLVGQSSKGRYRTTKKIKKKIARYLKESK